jgi:tRNA modification GTPase
MSELAPDTIFALASARGKAGIAVFRISGALAFEAVRSLSGALPQIRHAAVRRLIWDGQVLDDAVVLLFAEGHSFTGEAVAELQVHGSLAVVQAVAAALSDMTGLRQAEPGEFSRRALENGRLDLAQIEGLADLIDAETEMQRRQALRILSGAVGKRAEVWRRKLIRSAALIEAVIDFADEDVPVDVVPEVRALLGCVLSDLRAEVDGTKVAERVREGFEVAIVGAPNVGKSTLLNALAGREAAITSEVAGTTRDVIEVRMNLGGLPVTLLDTAGLRQGLDEVEKIGISRGMERAELADLRVFLLGRLDEVTLMTPKPDDVVVVGKADLHGEGVSGLTGRGVEELISRIVAVLEARVASAGVMTRERHRVAMLHAISAMESALDELEKPFNRGELVATELREALLFLDQLVGRIDVENLLDEIFASFCIGK